METPPPSPQGSPLQVTPFAIQAPNLDSPPPQTTLPPTQPSTYKRKIRSKKTYPIASAPPPTKQKELLATPTSKPPPKNPRTATSKQKGSSAFASHPQAKSPPSSKKTPPVAALKDRHDHLFDLIIETREQQKELKEMMKQLMTFLGMPPPLPSPPSEPRLQ
ncbi:extensin-like [Hevea brasiliensis]|uniref:extensin-like n=1 Tax=Hevea brasiliensis TaxID=3981 RepID=UPI0025E77794|nr:extensin-like [Hevea brasiliensis]